MNKNRVLATSGIMTILACSSAVQADDIDAYLVPPQDPVSPNVLFVLDESGSMGWDHPSRMSELKTAMKRVLDNTENDNINAAILAYTSRTHPTQVIHNFALIKDKRTDMKEAVDDLSPSGWTPSVHALASAMKVYIDDFNDGSTEIKSPVKHLTDAEDNWCRPNFVIFMSDGDPNSNRYTRDLGGDLKLSTTPDQYKNAAGTLSNCSTSTTETPYKNAFNGIIYRDSDENYDGSCTKEIVTRGRNIDLMTGGLWDADIPETDRDESIQNIVTYAIGMKMPKNEDGSVDETSNRYQYMNYIAYHGGGKYFPGDDADQLTKAFQQILDDAKTSIPYAYSAPTIPFNSENAAVSGDYLYLPLFEPGTTYAWKGNIKKFSISFKDKDGDIKIRIKDATKKPATTVKGGTIVLDDNTDFWNDTGSSDEAEVTKGGAASKMAITGSAKRNLYTDVGLNADDDLLDDTNRVHTDNYGTTITKTLLDADDTIDDAEARNLLRWISWSDTEKAHEGEMGAPLHTQATVVDVDDDGDGDYVLVSTVEGILHAFYAKDLATDKQGGQEAWAYMPEELLGTIKDFKANGSLIDEATGSFDSPLYGLDGPMTVYETGGKRYVVVAQRRGGRNLYALDISDLAAPKFAWKILGGTGDFAKLGQTWSKPIFATLQIDGGTDRDVLIFGGGYDPAQDDNTSRTDDSMGNAIFIVDAASGSKIKVISDSSADLVISDMKNSIPSNLLTVDINANGYVDRLYGVDVGGRVIRIDIPDRDMGGYSISGGIIADLNQGESYYRRFFNTPEVAYYGRGGAQFLTLLMATGDVANPLANNDKKERLYAVKDVNVWAAPASYDFVDTDGDGTPDRPIYSADLFDASMNIDSDATNDVDKVYAVDMDTGTPELDSPKGWYVNLATGQKGFSIAKVYDYAVLFTTYKGERIISTDSCVPSEVKGNSYLYALNMLNGKARFADITGIDGKKKLKIPGLPPAPQLLFPKKEVVVDEETGEKEVRLGGVVTAIAGLEKVFQWEDRFHPISWEEVIDD